MLRISVRKRITDANAAASHRKLLPLGECVGYSLRPIGCATATLAAAALVVSLVSEAVVDGVGWRDHGCGPSTKPKMARAANIFFMQFSLGYLGGSACLSQPPVP